MTRLLHVARMPQVGERFGDRMSTDVYFQVLSVWPGRDVVWSAKSRVVQGMRVGVEQRPLTAGWIR